MNKIILMATFAIAVGAAFSQVPDVAKIKSDAEGGNAMAQAQYAQILQIGNGVEKNEAEAAKWYQKAADAGNDYAQANLGVFYQTGGCGVQKDLQKAKEMYEKSAAQGNAYAQYCLARLYEDGTGVKKDAQKASEWYGKAAKGGMAAAQSVYAFRLAAGDGVALNLTEALVWCEKAASADDAMGKKLLPNIKKLKENSEKTPKSLLGIEFGKTIEIVTGDNRPSKLADGSGVEASVKPKKPFRKFTGVNYNGRIYVTASVTSHTVYRFKWESEDFTKDTKEEEAVEEIKKTCEVMAKKFGADFREIPIKESDKWTIWDRKYGAFFGVLKVELKLDARKITMTATHDLLEYKAKKEVEALKDAQGDGADAL